MSHEVVSNKLHKRVKSYLKSSSKNFFYYYFNYYFKHESNRIGSGFFFFFCRSINNQLSGFWRVDLRFLFHYAIRKGHLCKLLMQLYTNFTEYFPFFFFFHTQLVLPGVPIYAGLLCFQKS